MCSRGVLAPAVCSRVLNLKTGKVATRNSKMNTARFLPQSRSQSLVRFATGCDEATEDRLYRSEQGWHCVGVMPPESSEAQCPEGKDHLEDGVRGEDFENTITSVGLTSESTDAAVHSRLPPSKDERVQELAKVVDILSQSLLRLAEQVEALVRRKEALNGSVKGFQAVGGMSKSSIRRQQLNPVEEIDSPAASLDRVRADEDPASPRGRMEYRKMMQKREAQRRLTVQRKGIVKLNEDRAVMRKIREDDERFMGAALAEAKKAAMAGDVPVGAVIVQEGKIIARAYNRVESDGDSTAHAEMLCLRRAARHYGDWRLVDATLYVTLEPCPMCAGAILQSRVKGVVWGSRNTLLGADGSWVSLFPESVEEEKDVDPTRAAEHEPHHRPFAHPFHKNLEVRREVLADDCSRVMQSFFKARRQRDGKVVQTKPWWLPLQAWVLFRRLLQWLIFVARV